jgi:hypothetical protein
VRVCVMCTCVSACWVPLLRSSAHIQCCHCDCLFVDVCACRHARSFAQQCTHAVYSVQLFVCACRVALFCSSAHMQCSQFNCLCVPMQGRSFAQQCTHAVYSVQLFVCACRDALFRSSEHMQCTQFNCLCVCVCVCAGTLFLVTVHTCSVLSLTVCLPVQDALFRNSAHMQCTQFNCLCVRAGSLLCTAVLPCAWPASHAGCPLYPW